MRWKGLKAKAWEAVRAYIKYREKDCYTCPAKDLQGINAQAGHYFPVAMVGSNNQLSWDERFIHLQCSRCNGPGQGMQASYKAHLTRDYGKAAVEEFERRRHRVDPVRDWKAVIARYESAATEEKMAI